MRRVFFILIALSPFEATALLLVGGGRGYPIPVFYVLEVLFIFAATLRRGFKTRIGVGSNSAVLLVFWVWCVISVPVGLILFYGLPVYVPRLGIDEQVLSQHVLQLNLSSVGQVAFLTLHVTTYCFVCTLPKIDVDKVHRVIRLAAMIVSVFALWQFLHNEVGIYYPSGIIYHSSGSVVDDGIFGQIHRLSSTFLEPSFYGLYAAALASYFLFRMNEIRSIDGLMHLALAIQCIISTSTTGIVALAAGYIIYVVVKISEMRRRELTQFLAMGLTLMIVGGLFIAVEHSYVVKVLQYAILDKSSSGSYFNRTESNIFAWHVFIRTYGLGVGLGGNRPSSLLFYLLSNIGLIGVLLFSVFTMQMLRGQVRARYASVRLDSWVAARVALAVTLIGMVASVPDLTLPQLWMWIFVVAAVARSRSSDETDGEE